MPAPKLSAAPREPTKILAAPWKKRHHLSCKLSKICVSEWTKSYHTPQMNEDTMNHKVKCDFAVMARRLRMKHDLRQKQVAEAMAITPSTYGNLECSSFKTVRRERVDAMSRLYNLDAAEHAELVAAWERAPISEYSQRQKEGWDKRNAMRSKGKKLEEVKLVLCDLLDGIAFHGQHGGAYPVVCSCKPPDEFVGEDGYTCDLCRAFHALGFPDGYVSPQVAMDRIMEISPLAPGDRPVIRNTPHIPKAAP